MGGLVGGLVGWLVDWLVGWLVGWLVVVVVAAAVVAVVDADRVVFFAAAALGVVACFCAVMLLLLPLVGVQNGRFLFCRFARGISLPAPHMPKQPGNESSSWCS